MVELQISVEPAGLCDKNRDIHPHTECFPADGVSSQTVAVHLSQFAFCRAHVWELSLFWSVSALSAQPAAKAPFLIFFSFLRCHQHYMRCFFWELWDFSVLSFCSLPAWTPANKLFMRCHVRKLLQPGACGDSHRVCVKSVWAYHVYYATWGIVWDRLLCKCVWVCVWDVIPTSNQSPWQLP